MREAHREWTAVYLAGDAGDVVGYIEELPGVVAQGATIEEVRAMLIEGLSLVEHRDA